MNTFSTRTRRGAAILFSGALVLGGLALAGEAKAAEEVPGNPTCCGPRLHVRREVGRELGGGRGRHVHPRIVTV